MKFSASIIRPFYSTVIESAVALPTHLLTVCLFLHQHFCTSVTDSTVRQKYALRASLISCDECPIIRLCAQLNINVNYIMSGSTCVHPSPGSIIKMEAKEGKSANTYNDNTRKYNINFVMGVK